MNIEMIPLISFVIVTTFTPGLNNISSASMGVMYGYKGTFIYLVGIASGFFFVMIACAYLSSALLAIIPVAERYLRWVWRRLHIMARYRYSAFQLFDFRI